MIVKLLNYSMKMSRDTCITLDAFIKLEAFIKQWQ